MKKKMLALVQYAFFAALAAFFVWLSLKDMDSQKWAQLKDALDRANYWLLVPVLLLLLASHWLRALRWRQLIEPMGYEPSRINCFLGVMIGYFVNLGAPRLGEVVKCTILARYEKVPADKLVGTIVAERAFDVVCLAVVFGLTFLFQFNVIHSLTSGKTGALFQGVNGKVSYGKIGLFVAALVLFFFYCPVDPQPLGTYQHHHKDQGGLCQYLARPHHRAVNKEQDPVLFQFGRYLVPLPAQHLVRLFRHQRYPALEHYRRLECAGNG